MHALFVCLALEFQFHFSILFIYALFYQFKMCMALLFFHHKTNLLLTETDRKQSKQRANERTNANQFTKHTKRYIVGMLCLKRSNPHEC